MIALPVDAEPVRDEGSRGRDAFVDPHFRVAHPLRASVHAGLPKRDPSQPRDASFREVVAERLVLREPNGGRARAVVETMPSPDPEAGPALIVRLSLLDPRGEPALVAEIDPNGEPVLYVGHPDAGVSIVVSNRAIDAWAGGSVVASMRSEDGAGRIELLDASGRIAVALPSEKQSPD